MMVRSFLIAMIVLSPELVFAQAESIFNGIVMKESMEEATSKLDEIGNLYSVTKIENPTFPLATDSELHIVYKNLETEYGTIEKAVFTFADDLLTYIETKGNSEVVFNSYANGESMGYLEYTVYMSDKLFLKSSVDAAWIITSEGMHTNLFTWENPYLKENSEDDLNSELSNEIPSFIEMGAEFSTLESEFESNCKFTQLQELDGSDPNAQVQINCFGLSYAGFPRKFEARFGDEKLNVVWILTGKEEQERIRTALVSEFGEPIFVNTDWEIFNDWQVGLRKDKPEVLLMEKNIGLEYKSTYFGQ